MDSPVTLCVFGEEELRAVPALGVPLFLFDTSNLRWGEPRSVAERLVRTAGVVRNKMSRTFRFVKHDAPFASRLIRKALGRLGR